MESSSSSQGAALIVSCSSLLQIVVQSLYLGVFITSLVTIMLKHHELVKRAKWPTWLGLTLALTILATRDLRATLEYLESSKSSDSTRKGCVPINVTYYFCCDQFVPLTLFMMAYLDIKLMRITTKHQEPAQGWKWNVKLGFLLVSLMALQALINFSEIYLRQEAVRGFPYSPTVYWAYLVSTGTIWLVGLVIFYIFTKTIRELLKYIAVFEIESGSPFAQDYSAVIRPTTQFFHMQRPEIKDRFRLARTLTYTVVVIISIFVLKYALEIYRVMVTDHVSVADELGQTTTDDLLLGVILFLFNTMLYATLKFEPSPQADWQRKAYSLTDLRSQEQFAQTFLSQTNRQTRGYHSQTPGQSNSLLAGGLDHLSEARGQQRRRSEETGPRSKLDQCTSEDSSEVDVQKYHCYVHMTYGGQNFYMNRERHSATSSEKGVAMFNDRRRVDQLATESTLSPLSVHSHQMRQAMRMAKLMEKEFSLSLFA